MTSEPQPHDPNAAELQSFQDLADFGQCADCGAEPTREQSSDGAAFVTVEHADSCPTLMRLKTSQAAETTNETASNPQTLAKLRAFRLCIFRLTDDRAGAMSLDRELGDNRDNWTRLVAELVAMGWGEVLAQHGVDMSEPDADWPEDAYRQLEQERTAELDPERRQALKLTAILADPDTRAAWPQHLAVLDDPRPVVVALVDQFLSRRDPSERAELLSECLAAVQVLRRALGGGR
ncbi:hypothetical protein [Williamsia muralis]|uniref:hypothetical protein n=1 Tax=Williamsia marianensis TaxID=85044 RepID=UPI000DE6364A|nr:hypothetical protein [Williamsia marianensis]PVY29916.1 hypothetical protein C7458_105160 [Williamsia marianensis]